MFLGCRGVARVLLLTMRFLLGFRLLRGQFFVAFGVGFALLGLRVEAGFRSAAQLAWTSVHADEVLPAALGMRVEMYLVGILEDRVLGHCRTTEAQESLGVALLHQIGPVAQVVLLVEGQALGTGDQSSLAEHAVVEGAAFALVTQAVVAELVWAMLGGVGRLDAVAISADGRRRQDALAVALSAHLEEGAVLAELELANIVMAVDVGVALLLVGEAAIRLWTLDGG